MNSRDPVRQGRFAHGTLRPILTAAIAAISLSLWLSYPWLERVLFAGDLQFTAVEKPAGFRLLNSGEISDGRNPLAGLGGSRGSGVAALEAPSDLCQELFGQSLVQPGVVPIAYFTDYQCPYCRVLSQSLVKIEQEQRGRVRIIWHEWPVLGQASEQAARAALAARRQDAYAPFHARLMGTPFVPTPAYLRSVSERLDVDADRLLHDMTSAEVEGELARTKGLARVFGFRGTPGLVVGRTVVVGAIGDSRLRALIERELSDGPIDACREEAAEQVGLPRLRGRAN